MGAGISADGTRSHDSYFPAHVFLPGRFFRGKNSVPTGLITTIEVWRERKSVIPAAIIGRAFARPVGSCAPPAAPGRQAGAANRYDDGRSTLAH